MRLLAALALVLASALVQAADLSKTLMLVAKPELKDAMYGATVLVVTPLGGDEHIGFIVNRPSPLKLGADALFVGGPVGPDVIFALVERADSPGGKSLALMPGLYAAIDANTVDDIMHTEPRHARFVAGFVAWQPGELADEVERGAWYVLSPEPSVVLRQPQGLWEELVRRSKAAADAI
jgi:putative transcriptional regulator